MVSILCCLFSKKYESWDSLLGQSGSHLFIRELNFFINSHKVSVKVVADAFPLPIDPHRSTFLKGQGVTLSRHRWQVLQLSLGSYYSCLFQEDLSILQQCPQSLYSCRSIRTKATSGYVSIEYRIEYLCSKNFTHFEVYHRVAMLTNKQIYPLVVRCPPPLDVLINTGTV